MQNEFEFGGIDAQGVDLFLLIKKCEAIFQIPTSLPPNRDFDHKIPLIKGSNPIVVKVY